MPNSLVLPFVSFLLLLCTSCDNKIVKGTTPLEVFDAFWKIMDERYVYFPERNIDWDSVYHANYLKVKSFRSEEELKPVLQEIIAFTGDKHLTISINASDYISVPHDTTLPYFQGAYNRYGFGAENGDYPLYASFNEKHRGIVFFELATFTINSVDSIFLKLIENKDHSKGVIIDVRRNYGGDIVNALAFAGLFYKGNKIVFYKQHKSNKSHTGFSEKEPFYHQGIGSFSSDIPIVVLTSLSTYSAGNLFAYYMSALDNCTLIGTTTGGGGSGSQLVYLPNGWFVTYPTYKSYSIKGDNQEFGIAPDIFVPLEQSDTCDYQVLKTLEILTQNK